MPGTREGWNELHISLSNGEYDLYNSRQKCLNVSFMTSALVVTAPSSVSVSFIVASDSDPETGTRWMFVTVMWKSQKISSYWNPQTQTNNHVTLKDDISPPFWCLTWALTEALDLHHCSAALWLGNCRCTNTVDDECIYLNLGEENHCEFCLVATLCCELV